VDVVLDCVPDSPIDIISPVEECSDLRLAKADGEVKDFLLSDFEKENFL